MKNKSTSWSCEWVLGTLLMISSVCIGTDSPYGDDPFSPYHNPKKAFYMHGESVETRKGERVEIIARKVSLPNGLENYHSITVRDLSMMPHTDANDKVYELTEIFPNCKERNDLWVVYNDTTEYLVANVDLSLKSSVNEYVLSYDQDQAYKKAKMPRRLKFSLTCIEVDRSVALDLDSLNKAEKVMLFKHAGEVMVNDKYEFSNEYVKIKAENILDEGFGSIITLLEIQGSQTILTSSNFKLGDVGVYEVGIAEGNKKKLLVAEFALNLLTGETLDPRFHESIKNVLKLPFGAEDVSDLFYEMPDLFTTLGEDHRFLVVPPKWMEASEFAVVYDHGKTLRGFLGFNFQENEWLLQNYSTGKFYLNAPPSVKCDLEDLVVEMMRRRPHKVEAVATFYEVKSQQNESKQWNVQSLLSANPVLLGRTSFVTRSGELSSNDSLFGNAQLETIFNENGTSLDYALGLDLSLLGRDIKDEIKRKVKRDSVEYIELESGDEGRRVVMRLIVKDQRMKYNN